MQKSLIFLRSYGDFAMALSVLRHSTAAKNWIFYASIHLEPLYKDLANEFPELELNLQFIDLSIKKNVLGYFTNRHSIEWYSMIELLNLKRVLKQLRGEIHFEQLRKQWFIAPILGKTYPYIHDNTINIYESFCRKFDVPYASLLFDKPASIKKVLILPESRKPSKALPFSFVEELTQHFEQKGIKVTTAFFKKPNVASYYSFKELIQFIGAADYIITADSLPAHLAQLQSKPHFIYYENKMNGEWITPFSKANQTFGTIGSLVEMGLIG